MSTIEGHNREVRKRLKALSSKFDELYEAKVQEFDSSFSGNLSWLQEVTKAVQENADGYKFGLPPQKKFKVSADSASPKSGHSSIRLPKNFELFQSFNVEQVPSKRPLNGSIVFRSLNNDMNWVAALASTPRVAPKTPGRRMKLASNQFNQPTIRGQTPIKVGHTPHNAGTIAQPINLSSVAQAPGTPSKALFDAFTPIRDTAKRPAMPRRPIGSPYQEAGASRRVAASETRPAPVSRLAKEQEVNEDVKKKPKRKMESTSTATTQKSIRSSIRL